MVALEEWLQEKYIEYYDESDDYPNKPELLASKIKDLFLKEGTKNYVVYEGKINYLINKQSLPKDIRDVLNRGDSSVYSEYVRLIDVYGVTPDLKVYYCESGFGGDFIENVEFTEIDPTTKLGKVNSNIELKSAIADALRIDISEGQSLTIGDSNKLKSLTLSNVSSLDGIEEFKSLKTLTIKDSVLLSLSNLQSCINIEYVYLNSVQLANYNGLSELYDLRYLYLLIPPKWDEDTANNQIKYLGQELNKGTKIKNLEYVGIFGKDYITAGFGIGFGGLEIEKQVSDEVNQVTDLTPVSMWPSNLKSSIRYFYLNNNGFSNVDFLTDFSSIYSLWLLNCKGLSSLKGIENHTRLAYLIAQNCFFSNLTGVRGCGNLSYITVHNNSNFVSLEGVGFLENILAALRAYNCGLTDISDLEGRSKAGMKKLTYLDLQNNDRKDNADASKSTYLKDVTVLGKLPVLSELYLSGNSKFNDDCISILEAQINKVSPRYSLDDVYFLKFSNVKELDYKISTRCFD